MRRRTTWRRPALTLEQGVALGCLIVLAGSIAAVAVVVTAKLWGQS